MSARAFEKASGSPGMEPHYYPNVLEVVYLKPATHLAILYANRHYWQKSPGVPGTAIAIFTDRCIKSPMSGMSDIGD